MKISDSFPKTWSRRILAAALVLVLLGGSWGWLAGCSNVTPSASAHPPVSIAEMADKRVGMIEGTIFDAMVLERFPQAERFYFNTTSDMIAALQSGQIDCFLQNQVSVQQMIATVPGLSYLEEPFSVEQYGAIFNTDNAALCEQFNAVIAQLWSDGTIDSLRAKWMDGPEEGKYIASIALSAQNGTLKMATDSSKPPFSYVDANGYTGYDIELMMLIAERLDYGLEISGMSFGGILPAIASREYDFASAGIAKTEERAQSVLFSDPIFYGNTVCAVYEAPAGGDNPLAALVTGFQRTFVEEDRFKLIIDGLWTTLRITGMAVLLGTVLGFGFYFMAASRWRVLRWFVALLTRLLDGLPEVVILLISAYVVLLPFGLASIWVATIAFTVLFAVGFAQTMRLGSAGIERGQLDAGQALGFPQGSIFALIVLPQIVRSMLPVYFRQIIDLLKSTAIVGYIAVDDLTRVSDIIRSRTFDAFFPLLTTALIYFLLSWLLILLLRVLEKRLDPRRRRQVRGVQTQRPAAGVKE